MTIYTFINGGFPPAWILGAALSEDGRMATDVFSSVEDTKAGTAALAATLAAPEEILPTWVDVPEKHQGVLAAYDKFLARNRANS